MIDLAGSERAAYTNNKGIRMIEGANINKSQLALGNCINALADQAQNQSKSTKDGDPKSMRNVYVPFRDSKLTRLLKDSLGGNCRTLMCASVTPAITAYEDTLNTLKYAQRARHIKTTVSQNLTTSSNHISKYTEQINQLKEENEELKKLLNKSKQYWLIEQTNWRRKSLLKKTHTPLILQMNKKRKSNTWKI